jgi:DNA-binding SARP family transcriptional activator
LLDKLADEHKAKGDHDPSIAGWKGLVEKHPSEPSLQAKLLAAYEYKVDQDGAIAVWKALVELHPLENSIRFRLADALRQKSQKTRSRTCRPSAWVSRQFWVSLRFFTSFNCSRAHSVVRFHGH